MGRVRPLGETASDLRLRAAVSPSPPEAQELRGWMLVVVASTVMTVLLGWAGLPSPALFGSLLGAMAYALVFQTALDLPRVIFQVAQGVVGVTIGALVSLSTLQRLGTDWVPIVLVTLGTLVLSVLTGQALALHRTTSRVTGAFALIAGGASGITAIAHELGADDRVVTIVQYLRVVLVLLTLPLATSFVFDPARGGGTLATPTTNAWGDLAFTAIALVAGLVVARLTRIPAGSLLGPLLVALLLSSSSLLGTVGVPGALVTVAYAMIGIQVGLRFTRSSLRSIAGVLPLAVLLIVGIVLGCAGMGLLLSAVTGIDRWTAYLATTPGGVYAVLAIAADSSADVTFVLAVQVVRVLAMLFAAPVLARLLRPEMPPEG